MRQKGAQEPLLLKEVLLLSCYLGGRSGRHTAFSFFNCWAGILQETSTGLNCMRLQRALAKLTSCLFWIPFTEDGRPRNYPFGALANYRRNIIQADTAIDFDMDTQAARINHTAQATYLVKRGVYEGLPTKAGIY